MQNTEEVIAKEEPSEIIAALETQLFEKEEIKTEEIPSQGPKISPRHEIALNDLKTFIGGVLASKIEEVKVSVMQKVNPSNPIKKK